MSKIKISKDFVQFLKAFIKINESAVFSVKEDSITCLVGSPDNVTLAYGSIQCTSEYIGALNVPSILKLSRAIEYISYPEYDLIVNSNNLEYKSSDVRFKYHLLDNGILNTPLISIKKIQDFSFDVEFQISPLKLNEINKASTLSTDSNKIYISGDGVNINAELTDKSRSNIDSFSFIVAESNITFAAVSMSLEFIRSITYSVDSKIKVSINTQQGVIVVDVDNAMTKFKYITSAFTS